MGESWVSGLTWAFAAYAFGIATGWLIWGGRRSTTESKPTDEAVPSTEAPRSTVAGPASAQLKALEVEIRKAHELIDESEEEAEAFSEELATLDQSIKRANGRLKLILRAVQRRA